VDGGTDAYTLDRVNAINDSLKKKRMHMPDLVTPAGIRQAYPLHSKAPAHLKWSREAIKGLTYLVTSTPVAKRNRQGKRPQLRM